ncbi:GAF domain-containing sensor histidine kinase [Massilia sp. W12]|uniref:GAF domain-containing sensor histidine kinase n=1 Tax=Massilia sp. W12 TaxID=3126507 RepID=UPI0030D43C2A
MDLFAFDDEIAAWEERLQQASGAARLCLLLQLAWHKRERDTQAALRFAHSLRSQVSECATADAPAAWRPRLTLLEAEAKRLYADLDSAWELAQEALDGFRSCADPGGIADCHFLLSRIASDHGNFGVCDQELSAGVAAAEQAQDAVRVLHLQSEIASWAVLADLPKGRARWSQTLSLHDAPAKAQAGISNFHAMQAFQAAELGKAASLFMQTHAEAMQSGQLHLAILAAVNVGYAFARLNDHPAALEWKQRGLQLARPTGWPASIGAALIQTGETLRQLQRLPAAQDILLEACKVLAGLSASRNYAIALNYLGCLWLDLGESHSAYSTFLRLEQRAQALAQNVFQMDALCGQAQALLQLGRTQQALEAAQQAWRLAQSQDDPFHQIQALQVIASSDACNTLSPPHNTYPSARLYFLHQAEEIAQQIEGYTLPSDLYYAMAQEYAQVGDHAQAYQLALQARTAHQRTHTAEAANRAIAMQVHFQTERARNEGEHHRQLAALEARRAEVLQQTNETLERLGAIGQEITAKLEQEAIFAALDRHVHRLLDATCFAIYLLDADGQNLLAAFDVEAGVRLPPSRIALDDPDSYACRCLHERTEAIHNFPPDQEDPGQIPGTLVTLSALFAPLLVSERVLGVMTIQSERQFAYGERELLIFRTLCSYGAIALDNAHAYQQLQDAQSKLAAQDKLAALGSLVAGVAHELNTPIGNCLIAASGLHEDTQHFVRRVKEQTLRRSDLLRYCEHSEKASAILLRGLNSAADLVHNFKQVAANRNNARRTIFDLHECAHKVENRYAFLIAQHGHRLEQNITPGIMLDSYQEALEEVLSICISNALLHAFDEGQHGLLRMSAELLPGLPRRVRVCVADNGRGISEANLKRIFEPFFTTRLGQGGNGLGLSIAHNLMTAVLSGQISVQSKPGGGSSFVLDLPLCALGGDEALP